MELEITENTETLTHVALKGRLDTEGVDRVETRFNALLSSGGDGLVDLSGVTFLSSLGIRLLLGAAKMLDRRGATMVLIAPGEMVAEALKHSSIDEIIPVEPDLASARGRLRT